MLTDTIATMDQDKGMDITPERINNKKNYYKTGIQINNYKSYFL